MPTTPKAAAWERWNPIYSHFCEQFLAWQEMLCVIYNPAPSMSHRVTGLVWFPWIPAAPRGPAENRSPGAGQSPDICINDISEAEFPSALHAHTLIAIPWVQPARSCLLSRWELSRSPWSKDKYLYIRWFPNHSLEKLYHQQMVLVVGYLFRCPYCSPHMNDRLVFLLLN